MRWPDQLIPEPVLSPAYRIYEARLSQKLDRSQLPRHIGVILDGHRRHARSVGHADYAVSYREGMDKFIEFLGWSRDLGIPAVTGWLLSTENLKRPEEELEPYFGVLIEMFERLPPAAAAMGYGVRFIGSLDLLPAPLAAAAKRVEEKAGRGERQLTIALGYGGRQEIVDAVSELVTDLVSEGVPPDEVAARVTSDAIEAHLYTSGLPDPDLLIRTSGEARLSGFLLWQSAYAEFAFVDVFWPSFRRVDFLRALRDFTLRERRYGQ